MFRPQVDEKRVVRKDSTPAGYVTGKFSTPYSGAGVGAAAVAATADRELSNVKGTNSAYSKIPSAAVEEVGSSKYDTPEDVKAPVYEKVEEKKKDEPAPAYYPGNALAGYDAAPAPAPAPAPVFPIVANQPTAPQQGAVASYFAMSQPEPQGAAASYFAMSQPEQQQGAAASYFAQSQTQPSTNPWGRQ